MKRNLVPVISWEVWRYINGKIHLSTGAGLQPSTLWKPTNELPNSTSYPHFSSPSTVFNFSLTTLSCLTCLYKETKDGSLGFFWSVGKTPAWCVHCKPFQMYDEAFLRFADLLVWWLEKWSKTIFTKWWSFMGMNPMVQRVSNNQSQVLNLWWLEVGIFLQNGDFYWWVSSPLIEKIKQLWKTPKPKVEKKTMEKNLPIPRDGFFMLSCTIPCLYRPWII